MSPPGTAAGTEPTFDDVVVDPILRFDAKQIDWPMGLVVAVFVGVPIAFALHTSYTLAAVLLALGTLNVFLGAGTLAHRLRVRVSLLAALVNALAIAGGTLVAASGTWELPLIAVGIGALQLIILVPAARTVALSSCALFAIGVGLPGGAPGLAVQRAELILLGGLWAVVGILVDWAIVARWSRPSRDHGRAPIEPPTASPPAALSTRMATQVAVTVGVASAVAFGVGLLLGLPRDYWTILTVVVVVQLGFIATVSSTIVRVTATTAGAAVGGAISIALGGSWILGIAVAALAGTTIALRSASTSLYVFSLTPFVLLLLGIEYPSGWSVAEARVLDTLIGGAVAMLTAVVVFSIRGRVRRALPD